MDQVEFDRRVFRREFAATLGCGITWFRTLEKRGTIPQGKRDPGGKRVWWYASEVRDTLSRLAELGQKAA
jgi:predicted DNA-binding transcriptional regulator AlpA